MLQASRTDPRCGHVRPANKKVDRKDRRLAENQTGKRRVVVIMRELLEMPIAARLKKPATGFPARAQFLRR